MIDDDQTETDSNLSLATKARQSIFAMAIARGESIGAAAREAKVSSVTGYRWAGDDRVAALANTYRRRIVRQTCGRLASLGTRATERLSQLLDSADDGIALKAATAVLAEVRRIADATGDDIYRHAAPVAQEPGPLDDLEALSDCFAPADPDDEPLPKPPNTTNMTPAAAAKAESEWSRRCGAVRERNAKRRADKLRLQEHREQTEAEAMAAALTGRQQESSNTAISDDLSPPRRE